MILVDFLMVVISSVYYNPYLHFLFFVLFSESFLNKSNSKGCKIIHLHNCDVKNEFYSFVFYFMTILAFSNKT